MKSFGLRTLFLVAAAAAGSALSCAQSDTLNLPTGGTGGSGNLAETGGTGGTSATGAGGTSNTGGSVGSGGSATGGTVATGGSVGSGGSRATGGTTGTGGSGATGGRAGAGGSGAGGRGGVGGSGAGGRGGVGGSASGTGGTGGAGGAAATFASVTSLFAANCTSCHDGTNHTDLRATGLYARIVNQSPTKSTVAACESQKLIVPGNTAMSLISNKIKGTNLGGCNGRMPDGCSTTSANPRPCLTTAQIAIVDSWINAGAPM